MHSCGIGMRKVEVKQMSKDVKLAIYVLIFALVATVATAALGLFAGMPK